MGDLLTSLRTGRFSILQLIPLLVLMVAVVAVLPLRYAIAASVVRR